MDDIQQLATMAAKLGPSGLLFLVVVSLYWLNARVEKLEDESDRRKRNGK